MVVKRMAVWAPILAAAASFGVGLGGPAEAVTVTSASVLPGAISSESIGLNFAMNGRESSTVGTLDYTGQPGCGGICTLTTTLGSDPSASININEIAYANTAGGKAEAALGYYVAYLGTDGEHSVTVHTADLIDNAGDVPFEDELTIGQADKYYSFFNNFLTKDLDEADCNDNCVVHPPITDTVFQMKANTLYFVLLDVFMKPGVTGTQNTLTLDPTFSDNGAGGKFVFTPGVTDAVAAVPEPASWAMMIAGFGVIGARMRRRTSSRQASERGEQY